MRAVAMLLTALLLACSPRTAAPTPSPTPEATARPTASTVSGVVTWNHHPQPGVTVAVSALGAPNRGPALGTGIVSADGTFAVLFVPRTSRPIVGAFVPAHDVYLEGGRPATPVGDGAMDAGNIELRRAITGVSIRQGDQFKPGPLTFTWDVVPEATGYCVAVWPVSKGITSPECPSFVHFYGEVVTSARYTTSSLEPETYAVSVIAITDTVIGELPPPGLSFTVR